MSRIIHSILYPGRKVIKNKNKTTPMGFEPTRAEHIGLAVQRLNHSATVSTGIIGKNDDYKNT